MTTFKSGDRVIWIEHNPDAYDGVAHHVGRASALYGAGPFTVMSVEEALSTAAGHSQFVKIRELAGHRFEGRLHDGIFSGAYFRKAEA